MLETTDYLQKITELKIIIMYIYHVYVITHVCVYDTKQKEKPKPKRV